MRLGSYCKIALVSAGQTALKRSFSVNKDGAPGGWLFLFLPYDPDPDPDPDPRPDDDELNAAAEA